MKKEYYIAPDISYHNGNVNIKAIRDSGHPIIGVRCGYGKNNIDQRWLNNATAMKNLNVTPIVYWFSYAFNEEMAAKEAEYCITEVSKYWKKILIAFDLEYDTINYAARNGITIGKSLATKMAIAFLKKVKEYGHYPVLYTNRDYMLRMFDMSEIEKSVGDYYIWYARYSDSLTSAEEKFIDFWQYTSKGTIDGVKGNVDLNKIYIQINHKNLLNVEKTNSEAVPNVRISDFQSAANSDGYKDLNGNRLEVDGIDGPKTESVKNIICLKAKRTLFGYTTGSFGAVVKWVQRRLNECINTNLKVDGFYGSSTRKAIIEFQKQYNLKVDGIVGKNTINMLFWN